MLKWQIWSVAENLECKHEVLNWFIGGDLTCEKTGIGLVSENCFYKGDI
jgi:hypothetical protein